MYFNNYANQQDWQYGKSAYEPEQGLLEPATPNVQPTHQPPQPLHQQPFYMPSYRQNQMINNNAHYLNANVHASSNYYRNSLSPSNSSNISNYSYSDSYNSFSSSPASSNETSDILNPSKASFDNSSGSLTGSSSSLGSCGFSARDHMNRINVFSPISAYQSTIPREPIRNQTDVYSGYRYQPNQLQSGSSGYDLNAYSNYVNQKPSLITRAAHSSADSEAKSYADGLDNLPSYDKSDLASKKTTNFAQEFEKNILPLLTDDSRVDSKRRGRTSFSTDQRRYLLSIFERTPYPAKEILEIAAKELRVSTSIIQTWFKNTRSKQKKLTNTKNMM